MKNMPEDPTRLAELIEVRPGQVVSMEISKRPGIQMTLFAFAEGEGVGMEIYPGDTWYLVVEGKMMLRRNGKKLLMEAGDCAAVPAGTAHAVRSQGPFKMLQIMLRAEE